MRQLLSTILFVAAVATASPAVARIPVSTDGCDPALAASSIEDILALESTDDESIIRIEITCTGLTTIEVFTSEQSLTRRIAPEQIPANGAERFLALNAAEMVELFARPASAKPEPHPDRESESAPESTQTESVADAMMVEPEPEYDSLKLHVAGLARFDLGAPSAAGGFAIEVEFAPTQSFVIAADFQTATASSGVSGATTEQLFLASALKGGYALDGARFLALVRVGGVKLTRDASDSNGWAFWGGPALSAGYRLPIAGPLWLDGSAEIGYSPWTWGGRFDGRDIFRTENIWFGAQLGLTVSF